jgi:hypothetical protein
MSFFNKKSDQPNDEQPLYESSVVGGKAKVYKSRLDLKRLGENESIPLNQIASVKLGPMGQRTVIVETAGGKKYTAIAKDKNALRQAIVSAMESGLPQPNLAVPSATDELEKLAALKEKGIITQADFDAKKKQLLGL